MTVTLYGAPHSLYTGKTRALLRKQGVAYVEKPPSDPVFRERIVPVIGRSIIPVVEWPDGRIVQDSVDILDVMEAEGPRYSAVPPGARQRVLAHVVELYASMGLIRHAMHYRWSYRAEQEKFLLHAFAGGAGRDYAAAVMARMNSYLPALGVDDETIPLIEASYARLLETLDAHFALHPYLFGAQPSLGDYGLLGPLYAHLGRDPVPAGLMKRSAPNVFRWVERMNAPDLDLVDCPNAAPGYLAADAVPETLAPLFRQIAGELFPEILDKRAALDARYSALAPADGTPVSDKAHQRTIGVIDTQFLGKSVQVGVQPYLLYLWRRIEDAAAQSTAEEQAAVQAYLEGVGLGSLIDRPSIAKVGRRGHVEVWLR